MLTPQWIQTIFAFSFLIPSFFPVQLVDDHMITLVGAITFFYSFAILLRVMLTSVDISEKAWDIEFLIVF